MPKARTRIALLLTPVLMSGFLGCAYTQYQRHYFTGADIEASDPEIKFYRTTIHAKSRNTNSHIHMGMHDANAVRQLYGALPDPSVDSSAGMAGSGPRQFRWNEATRSWQIVDDQVFTVIYGADATAIANQIGMFAQSLEDGDAMARLMGAAVYGDLYEEVKALEAEQTSRSDEDKTIGDGLKAIADGLPDSGGTQAAAEAALDKSMRILVSSLNEQGVLSLLKPAAAMTPQEIRDTLLGILAGQQ